eukprot:Gregarina_sp_Poly_1__3567@NODE_2043_length_2783_cov_80_576951_g1318_i0_p1_GENE_NODE_2043_length_2783_cov_80_576951_g1318_i0NODE_2043_length_2783_cov_80_576951_g1318_i0_p1_ORF_typecomplete_len176_score6_27_NODE_2043_length_2783_cov_80_576951_g1318_i011361663
MPLKRPFGEPFLAKMPLPCTFGVSCLAKVLFCLSENDLELEASCFLQRVFVDQDVSVLGKMVLIRFAVGSFLARKLLIGSSRESSFATMMSFLFSWVLFLNFSFQFYIQYEQFATTPPTPNRRVYQQKISVMNNRYECLFSNENSQTRNMGCGILFELLRFLRLSIPPESFYSST